ncbi:MAG TPA: hypothetical protein VGP03_14110, partial [Pseudonocardiaceae bacterium]|nr:hypothetical protein [Pseudonocardiaceae bacterium]
MNDELNDSPDRSRPRPRLAPQVVLAVAGVVVATLFAAVATIATGQSEQAAPAENPQPREDVVSKGSLTTSAPRLTTTAASPVSSSSAESVSEE